jgi:phage-related protein
MPQTFSWFPDASVQKSVEPRVRVAKFGDGYEQRVRDGINTAPEKWSLTFTGGAEEVNAIDAFLKLAGGADYFYWTTPQGMAGKFVCRSWKFARERGSKSSISCDFEQVFDL